MSRDRWGLKSPEKFLLTMPIEVAEQFRNYCGERHFVISKVLTDLVIDHLVEEQVIDDATALSMREGQVVTPFLVDRQKRRAHDFAVIEAATKEAETFNSTQYRTGKQASQ